MEYFAKITLNEDAFNAHNEKCDDITQEEYIRQEFGWVNASGIQLEKLHKIATEQDALEAYKSYLINYALTFAAGTVAPMSYEAYIKHLQTADNEELAIAIEHIKRYVECELEGEAMLQCLSQIPIGYTTSEDGEHEVQAYADLERFRIYTTVDDVKVRERQYDSLQSLVDNELTNLCFDELIAVSEEEIAMANQKNDSLNTVDMLKINVAGGRLEATVMHDSDYPGIDVEYIPNCEKPCGMVNPRVLVEFPKDEQLRALIWDDPQNEDYTKEIIFENDKTFECPLGGDETNDCADCAYSCDYHFKNGECVRREDDTNG